MPPSHLVCPSCKTLYEFTASTKTCARCGAPLFTIYENLEHILKNTLINAKERAIQGLGVWSFSELLPVRFIGRSLGEGWTPIVKLERLSNVLGVDILVKNESRNPSGTFIDRGTAIDVQAAYESKFNSIISASLGDYAISLSMYAKRYGIHATHYIPEFVEPWKLYMLTLLGDAVIEVEDYLSAIKKSSKLAEKHSHYLSIPCSPTVMDGYRTIVFEVVETLQKIDWIAVPVGDGVLATAIFKGLNEIREALNIDTPRILTVKLEESYGKKQKSIETVLVELSGGVTRNIIANILKDSVEYVSIEKNAVFDIAAQLAELEGVVVDPVGVASLAGVKVATELGVVGKGERVLVVISGSPSKDSYVLYKVVAHSGRSASIYRIYNNRDMVYVSNAQKEILKILYEARQCHTYGIWKKLVSLGYSITLQTVHHHLKSLVEKGYVRVLSSNGRRVLYTISELGEEYLDRELGI
uniref:Pyridoxal-phosphate dependent enzyme n=1 Tax=Ignisphaera aggregans TaxID=334771 RepID=A0A7C4FDK5_9CREN